MRGGGSLRGGVINTTAYYVGSFCQSLEPRLGIMHIVDDDEVADLAFSPVFLKLVEEYKIDGTASFTRSSQLLNQNFYCE